MAKIIKQTTIKTKYKVAKHMRIILLSLQSQKTDTKKEAQNTAGKSLTPSFEN